MSKDESLQLLEDKIQKWKESYYSAAEASLDWDKLQKYRVAFTKFYGELNGFTRKYKANKEYYSSIKDSILSKMIRKMQEDDPSTSKAAAELEIKASPEYKEFLKKRAGYIAEWEHLDRAMTDMKNVINTIASHLKTNTDQ